MSECFILLRPQPLSERKCAGKRNTAGKLLPPQTGPSCVTGDLVPRLEPPCAHRGREGTADLTHWLCPVLGYKMVIKKAINRQFSKEEVYFQYLVKHSKKKKFSLTNSKRNANLNYTLSPST